MQVAEEALFSALSDGTTHSTVARAEPPEQHAAPSPAGTSAPPSVSELKESLNSALRQAAAAQSVLVASRQRSGLVLPAVLSLRERQNAQSKMFLPLPRFMLPPPAPS